MSRVFSDVRLKPQARGIRRGRRRAHDPRGTRVPRSGLGTPILIGREETVREAMKAAGREDPDIEVHNAAPLRT